MRTRCPDNYLSPNIKEIREMADRIKIQHYEEALVQDMAHIAAGGELLPEHHWQPALEQAIVDTLEPPNSDGEWYVPDLDQCAYSNNRNTVIEYRTKKALQYHRNICDFLLNLDFEKVPGRSPLEQAMNVLKLLSQHEGGKSPSDDAPLPIFAKSDTDGNETADSINVLLKHIESLDSNEQELLQSDDAAPSTSAGVGTNRDLTKMKLASDMSEGKKIWLKVSRNLNASSKLKVRKSVKFLPDPEGDEVRTRPIEHLGELSKVRVAEYALPKVYRMYRIAAKVALMRERGYREEKQQLLYILIDSSLSMEGERTYYAGGVLMNRLKAVISGDAQVYVRLFDEELHDEHYATTPAEAKTLMNQFHARNFSGGGTEITESLKGAQKRIEEILKTGESLTRPELVIVTDGEDDVSDLRRENFGLTKVHAFVIDNTDMDLINFARSTGGVGVHIETGADEIPF